MKRFACVYFPKWPMQRLESDRPELRRQAFAVTGLQRGRPMVTFCSETAARDGVRPGMPVAEALATCPGLPVIDEDPDRDRQVLQDLAYWAERFSPIVGLEEGLTPECLLLDVTGCAACFGGEDNLLRRIDQEFKATGWYVRVALAGTIGAAWALAHYLTPRPPSLTGKGEHPPLSPKGERGFDATLSSNWATRERGFDSPLSPLRREGSGERGIEAALWPLPIEALRLSGELVELLHSLGLERIEALLALPRSGLVDRLGQEVVTRLDQALGRIPEVVTAYRQLPDIHAFYSLPYATDRLGLLKKILEGLIEHVCKLLEERKQGVRQLECRLYYEENVVHSLRECDQLAERVDYFQVGLVRASRSPGYLGTLLQTCLEGVRLAGPVNALGLFARQTEPLFAEQSDFFQPSEWRQELAELIDSLNSRLGRDAVTRPVLMPDAQPEFAYRLETPNPKSESRNPKQIRNLKHKIRNKSFELGISKFGFVSDFEIRISDLGFLPRPTRLLSRPAAAAVVAVFPEGPPARFRWEGQEHPILRAWGPERIETGWWRGEDVQRDYYQVMTQSGARFWLFRRRDNGRWFVHGYFE